MKLIKVDVLPTNGVVRSPTSRTFDSIKMEKEKRKLLLLTVFYLFPVLSLLNAGNNKDALTLQLQKKILFEVGEIPQETTQTVKAKTDFSFPDNFPTNSAKLKKAWLFYKKISNNYNVFIDYKTFTPQTNYLENKREFYDLINAVLNNEQLDKPAEKIRDYRWGKDGHWTCGYLAHEFHEPQELTYALTFIREKKYDMALTALLDYLFPQGNSRIDASEMYRLFPAVKRLSQILNNDWETICAGAICDNLPLPSFLYMGTYGGQVSIDYLNELNKYKQLLKPSSKKYVIKAINCFISDLVPYISNTDNLDPGLYSFSSSEVYFSPRESNYTILPAEKTTLINLFNNVIQKNSSLDNTELYLKIIKERNNPILVPGLKSILNLPYPTMRYKAGVLLRKMGEDIKTPEKPLPVVFQFTINGATYKNATIDSRQKISPGTYSCSNKTTNDKGIIFFDPDIFFDSTRKISRLYFLSEKKPFFNVTYTPPFSLHKKREVNIKTSSLHIKLTPQNINNLLAKTLRITITPEDKYKNPSHDLIMFNNFKTDIICKKEPLLIKEIQRGQYQVKITAPRFKQWEGKINLRDSLETLKAELVPLTILKIELDDLD